MGTNENLWKSVDSMWESCQSQFSSPTMWFHGLISDHWTWHQGPLPAQPHMPFLDLCN